MTDRVCTACGFPLRPGDNFCMRCRAPVAAPQRAAVGYAIPPASAAPAAPAQERSSDLLETQVRLPAAAPQQRAPAPTGSGLVVPPAPAPAPAPPSPPSQAPLVAPPAPPGAAPAPVPPAPAAPAGAAPTSPEPLTPAPPQAAAPAPPATPPAPMPPSAPPSRPAQPTPLATSEPAAADDDPETMVAVTPQAPDPDDDEPPTMVAVSRRYVLTNTQTQERFELRPPCVVGRGRAADVKVGDSLEMGRRHAQIFLEGDAVMVRDLGSTNGTSVGDVEVPSQWSAPIESGATLRLGTETFTFTVEGA